MVLAAYYDWLPSHKTSRPLWVFIPVALIVLPTLLVLKQPDLGTSILLLAAGGGLMFLAGVHWAYFAAVIAAVVGLIAAVFNSRGTDWQLLKDYQFRRIDTFLDPLPILWVPDITSRNPRSPLVPGAGTGAVSCRVRNPG